MSPWEGAERPGLQDGEDDTPAQAEERKGSKVINSTTQTKISDLQKAKVMLAGYKGSGMMVLLAQNELKKKFMTF